MNNNKDYKARLTAALAELDSRGVRTSMSRPPYFRIARHYNLKVRPPYYASIAFNATFSCVIFAIVFGLAMWLIVWSKTDISVREMLVHALNVGVLVGLASALFCHVAFRLHKLTPWERLLNPNAPLDIRQ